MPTDLRTEWIAAQRDRLQQELKNDRRTFFVAVASSLAAILTSAAAIAGVVLALWHFAPPSPQRVIIEYTQPEKHSESKTP